MGRDGMSLDERGEVRVLDKEFPIDALRSKFLRADQPPHGAGPDA